MPNSFSFTYNGPMRITMTSAVSVASGSSAPSSNVLPVHAFDLRPAPAPEPPQPIQRQPLQFGQPRRAIALRKERA